MAVGITRGTTPGFVFHLPFNTSIIKSLYVTFADLDEKTILEKTKEDCILEEKTVQLKLSQTEALKFESKQSASVQLRVLTTDGEAMASKIYDFNVAAVLKDGVIE